MQRATRRLADHEVLPALAEVAQRDRTTTARMLVLIGRADAARLYAPTRHDSMFAYCVGELRMSEDVAYKRIRVARAARRCPAILERLADGRLHLSGAYLLAPHLRRENAAELLEAATHRSKFDIERLLAERFPRPALLPAPRPEDSPDVATSSCQLAPGPVAPEAPAAGPDANVPAPPVTTPTVPISPRLAPGPVARITPLLHDCLLVEFTIGDRALDKLRYAKALLGHAVPTGDLARVIERALDALIAEQEKRKFAVTSRTPRDSARKSTDPRHIPAAVRRAVVARDGGCCTFESAAGHRCGSRKRLEFDHIEPVAKGGASTAENLRLRCRTHNQHAAEQAFGAAFIEGRRAEARERSRAKRRAASAADAERARREAHARELAANEAARARAEEVVPWLRTLGFRAGEARRAAEASGAALPDAPLEARVRHALRSLAPPGARKVPAPSGDAAACGAAAGG